MMRSAIIQCGTGKRKESATAKNIKAVTLQQWELVPASGKSGARWPGSALFRHLSGLVPDANLADSSGLTPHRPSGLLYRVMPAVRPLRTVLG